MNFNRNKTVKKSLLLSTLSLAMVFFVTSCSSNSNDTKTATVSEMFTARDLDITYDTSSAITINLSDKGTVSSSSSVKISGNTITLSDEGTYILSGTLSDGQIIVDAEDTDKLQIVLDDANINSSNSAAIYVEQADKIFLTTAEDSSNTLTNSGVFSSTVNSSIDAAIFSKDDLTLNGAGTLTVSTSNGHGIVSKDDLVLTSGTYDISASGHGLSANNSVRISDGDFKITTGQDGIQSENADTSSLGFVYIQDGSYSMSSGTDGISSSGYMQIKGGTFTITAGKVSNNNSSASTKGLKAVGTLNIDDGQFTVTATDDAIHSESSLAIEGGSLTLSSGDDGIHANSNVTITSGTVSITKSYEGIEGQSIDIKGGTISLVSSDDGLNASGGNDSSGTGGNAMKDEFAADENSYIKIHDGTININSSGDGVDSNGSLYVYGGQTYVSGPTNDGNGSLDYNGEAEITGGIFIAAGSSGMAQNFGTTSTQGSILVNVSGNSSSAIILKDSSGKEVSSFTPSKSFSSVVISCPEIEKDKTYTLSVGGTSKSINMTTLIYGSGGGMGGGGGPRP